MTKMLFLQYQKNSVVKIGNQERRGTIKSTGEYGQIKELKEEH